MAFALLRDVAGWLAARGRRQRIAATTLETYLAWQSRQANWGLFDGRELAGIFTLVAGPLDEWPRVAVEGDARWLRALAVAPARGGTGVGAQGVAAALALVPADDWLHLDCVSDFLPSWYERHGFERVARQVRSYPDGTYDITLMRRFGTGPRRGTE